MNRTSDPKTGEGLASAASASRLKEFNNVPKGFVMAKNRSLLLLQLKPQNYFQYYSLYQL